VVGFKIINNIFYEIKYEKQEWFLEKEIHVNLLSDGRHKYKWLIFSDDK